MNDELDVAKTAASQAPLFSDDEWTQIADGLRMSPQQRRIVALVLAGFQDKQVAHELNISVPTVRTYFIRIYSKLHVSDRLELVLSIFREFRRLQALTPEIRNRFAAGKIGPRTCWQAQGVIGDDVIDTDAIGKDGLHVVMKKPKV